MALSKLKLSPDKTRFIVLGFNAQCQKLSTYFPANKTEFIVFGYKAQCQQLSCHFPVNILRTLLHPADTVNNLCGFMLAFLSQNTF